MDNLLTQYADQKTMVDSATEKLADYKADLALSKAKIRSYLDELGMKSAKTDIASASIASKPKLAITNEAQVIQWLKDTPEIEEDTLLKLDRRGFDTIAKEWEKQTGELIQGTEHQTSEYLTVKLAQ